MPPFETACEAKAGKPPEEIGIRQKMIEFLSKPISLGALRTRLETALGLSEAPEVIVNEGSETNSEIIPRVISLSLKSEEHVVSNLFEEMSHSNSRERQENINQIKKIAEKFLNRYLGTRVSAAKIRNDLQVYLNYPEDRPVTIKCDDEGFIKKITISIPPSVPFNVVRGYRS